MAHPILAARDPIYWLAILILLSVVPALFWAWRASAPSWAKVSVAAVLVLCVPSGCYAMLGTACYVYGDCP